MTSRVRRSTLPVAVAAAALMLGGCGSSGSSTPAAGGGGASGGSSTGTPGSSSSGGPSGTASSGQAQGVTLTPQGSQLKLGETAKVTWQPQGKPVSVAALTVTKLQKVPISVFADWKLDKTTQRSTPYFVRATVKNLGHSDLGGATVPLFLLDQSNTLLQPSTFEASFPRCPSRPLPSPMKQGKSVSVCLVYFVVHHGTLQAVSFRPSGDFTAITWTGHVGHGG